MKIKEYSINVRIRGSDLTIRNSGKKYKTVYRYVHMHAHMTVASAREIL